jgi:hypothetical protein
VAAAILVPAFWLVVSRDPSDAVLIWLVPVLTGLLIALAGLRTRRGPTPLKALCGAVVFGRRGLSLARAQPA